MQISLLDVPTLSFVAACIAGLLGLFLIFAWLQQRNIGALAWWGFTVLTHIAFGLFAVAIGYLVGHGAVRFAGGKRSGGLQALSIGVALLSYLFAIYLVNMTFINKALGEQGEAFRVGFPPQSLGLLIRVVTVDVGVMDLVFLAIVVYEAWKIPRPLTLPPEAAA